MTDANFQRKLNEILLTVEKPARYVGGEYNTPDMKKPFEANLLLCFPDVYEIGMSNLGLSILYQLINSKPDFMAERCYAPWPDFGKKLKENDIPLFSLENRKKFTDFDVVAWQRAEMRGQLDRELARAMLLGDGRELSSDDKINEQNIRPVLKDDDMYTIKYTVKSGQDYKVTTNSASDNDSVAKGVIRAAIKSRKEYKGSGNPTFFTTEDLLTELLLIEDQNGRRIYDSINTLATAMRVKEIVTVPEMESHTDIYGIIVNMADYTTGADKGGAVSMFDDFDIDYNQMKYLMETRMSGALTKPYSAIVLKKEAGGAAAGGAGASEAAG